MSVTTIHITGNTVANLNLGTVIGDLNGSIKHLTEIGIAQLAEALKNMTEAVGDSKEIEEPAKKEVLEHLAVVSAEAAYPSDKRKIGPLKTSLEAIKIDTKAPVAVGQPPPDD